MLILLSAALITLAVEVSTVETPVAPPLARRVAYAEVWGTNPDSDEYLLGDVQSVAIVRNAAAAEAGELGNADGESPVGLSAEPLDVIFFRAEEQ